MNIIKKLFLIVIILNTIAITGLYAQTFEEYKKQRQQELQKFKDEREKQIQNLANEFDKYVEKQDREFTEYLKERWREFEVFQGIEAPEEPKPDDAPIFKELERPRPPTSIPTIKPALEQPPSIVPSPILPRVTKQEPSNFPVSETNFDFYGFPVIADYDTEFSNIRLEGEIDEEAISSIFNQLSTTNYNNLLEQLFGYTELMNLNDWGYYMLIKSTSESLSSNNQNMQKVFTWFLLIRSGYKAKIAYYENDVFLLLPFRNQVYGVNFFNLNGTKYYLMDGDLNDIYTYEKDFPEAQKSFDLNLYKSVSLGDDYAIRDVHFEYLAKEINIPVEYSENLVDFYKNYPLADIKVYFDAVVSTKAKISLSEAFIPLIDDKSELEAVNLLLRFVQSGFAYQTDQEQFGYEKFFFAEEAFYYPYCDCEDRSVLFAYLVQELLGLNVIGLNYPGHVATAVCFNKDVAGDYIMFEGKKYIVSDPTYINAPVGLTMPEYKTVQAEIIELDNKYVDGNQKRYLWDDVIAGGGRRGDNGRDMILNDNGSGLVTGYFINSFNFGNINKTGSEKPSMFTMMIDDENNPIWFNSSEGEGMAMAYNIARDGDDNYYVAGTYKGEIELDGEKIISENENPDVFLAKYNSGGNLLWLNNANIDTANKTNEPGNTFLNFVITFADNGTHIANELYFETADFSNYGISILQSGEVVVAGAFNKTTGMNKKEISFDALGDFNAVEALKSKNDMLITEKYEKSIAGLFAVIYLVQSSGISIPGSAAMEVINKYNPKFKTDSPNLYKSIGKIQFIKNEEGVVTIKTDGNKGLSIDMMRINNDARIKISMLENGDARIDVLSGIRVGKAMWWYDLNYILMYKQNGDLMFDYDTDHSQTVINLKIDILY